MPDFLPLFPLKLVVFPGERLNLHIFEPRYKQLIRECEQNRITFGIPAHIDDKVMVFGTEIQLLKVEKRYPNGEMDVRTKGIGIFKIREYYSEAPNKLYAGADIERLEMNHEKDLFLSREILIRLKELFLVLNIKKVLPKDEENYETYELAHHVGFSLEQEYEFLTLPTELERQQYMLDHLERLIPIVKEMERLRKRAEMNGHFKNVLPPK